MKARRLDDRRVAVRRNSQATSNENLFWKDNS